MKRKSAFIKLFACLPLGALAKWGRFSQAVFSILLLSAIFYLLSATPIFAAETTKNPYTQPNLNPDVPKNLHTWTQTVMIEVMSSLSCQLSGIDPTNPKHQCLGVDQKTGKIGFVENGGGAIGVMSHMITMLYDIPIHTGDYTHYLAQNFGIATKANAQSQTGFEGLRPLIGIWTAFRNIVYVIFTIIFVIIGLAIMFRVKIDPRTVMTLQNQIPKIIIGIVLVTFSYAIAGFLIDIMYGSIYLIGNTMSSAGKITSADVTEVLQTTNPIDTASKSVELRTVTSNMADTASEFIKPLFENPVGKIITGVIGFAIGTQVKQLAIDSLKGAPRIARSLLEAFRLTGKSVPIPLAPVVIGASDAIIGGTIGALAGWYFADDIAGFAVKIIAWLIIFITLMWALFRLWFELIYAFVYILIDVVLAPFWIAVGLIPGSKISFTGWLRHLLAFVAVFPTTFALFLLGSAFIHAFKADNAFVPPFIANPSDKNGLAAIIGLVIVLLSSNVRNMTFKMFNAPVIDLGRVAQSIGVGVGVPKSVIGSAFEYQKKIPNIGEKGGFGSLFGRVFGR